MSPGRNGCFVTFLSFTNKIGMSNILKKSGERRISHTHNRSGGAIVDDVGNVVDHLDACMVSRHAVIVSNLSFNRIEIEQVTQGGSKGISP